MHPDSSRPSYSEFFKAATETPPYPWQERLADTPAPASGEPGQEVCRSCLIDIPTGLGKTAGVILAWLYNRVACQNPEWPRRLVFCLPMRVLVEQTQAATRGWIEALTQVGFIPKDHSHGKPRIILLMGGEDLDEQEKAWDIHPEDNVILIGTQDMLISRALNRGYGMSRYRWPMHFALLNNDALWVMDEVQLMGVTVETSAQLAAFRQQTGTRGPCATWWMSATLTPDRLGTVDHREAATTLPTLSLSEEEKDGPGRARQLIQASKPLCSAHVSLDTDTSKGDYAAQMATLIRDNHREGSLTLVVVNRVRRAREIFIALTGGKNPLYDPAKVALIHSRFRPMDRKHQEELLNAEGDRIVIATQAVEAGVDVSARLLITELAPWSSLVQRFGRCNRRADQPDAQILLVDILPKDEKDELCLPYTEAALTRARAAVQGLENASSVNLRTISVPEEKVVRPVLRRRDLTDLFDTTPDLCGQDLDVSRYIRDNEDSDVQFYWRDLADKPATDEPRPARDELCRVAVGEANAFLGKLKGATLAWRWDPLARQWEPARRAHPGAVILLTHKAGGYCETLGWTGDPKKHLPAHVSRPPTGPQEAYGTDPRSVTGQWLDIAGHTAAVVEALQAILSALDEDPDAAPALLNAAHWHDVGKAHPAFQQMLTGGDPQRQGTLWAKSDHTGGKLPAGRRGFRHELASALTWLQAAPGDAPERDLSAYLIAAHHGKVRLSIRSLPEETGDPNDPDRLFARGVWDKDRLPAVPLAPQSTPEVTLDLSPMQMGTGPLGPSWLARTLALRDRFGPFVLAYLETLLRAADARGSATSNHQQQ